MSELRTIMTVVQLRKMKPRRVLLLSAEHLENKQDYEECDFIFGDERCYRIHRISGETVVFDTHLFGKDWSKEVEGLPENKEIQVPLHVYKNYLELVERGKLSSHGEEIIND